MFPVPWAPASGLRGKMLLDVPFRRLFPHLQCSEAKWVRSSDGSSSVLLSCMDLCHVSSFPHPVHSLCNFVESWDILERDGAAKELPENCWKNIDIPYLLLHEEADLLIGHCLIMLSFLRWIWWAMPVAFSTVSSFHFASLFCLPNSAWSCDNARPSP